MSYTTICKRIRKICKLDCENEDKKVFSMTFIRTTSVSVIIFLYSFLGHWNYTHTIRRPKVRNQVIEVKTQLSHRDYMNLLSQKDETHFPILKKRRCFIHNNQYFQLDIYCKPGHPRYVIPTFSLKSLYCSDIYKQFMDICPLIIIVAGHIAFLANVFPSL